MFRIKVYVFFMILTIHPIDRITTETTDGNTSLISFETTTNSSVEDFSQSNNLNNTSKKDPLVSQTITVSEDKISSYESTIDRKTVDNIAVSVTESKPKFKTIATRYPNSNRGSPGILFPILAVIYFCMLLVICITYFWFCEYFYLGFNLKEISIVLYFSDNRRRQRFKYMD